MKPIRTDQGYKLDTPSNYRIDKSKEVEETENKIEELRSSGELDRIIKEMT